MSLNHQVSSLLSDVHSMRQMPMPSVRHGIAQKMSHLYNAGIFEEGEVEIAHEILRLLAADAEMRVRKVLSDNLKANRDLPRDVALKLANDVLEVALPILEFSTVLTDQDLINIVQSTKEIARLRAIARRHNLSGPVSHALIQSNHEDVVITLANNKTSQIPEIDFQDLISHFQQNGRVIESLVYRGNLPIGIAEKLVVSVTGAMKQKLMNDYQITDRKVHDLMETVREQSTLGLLKKGKTDPITAPTTPARPAALQTPLSAPAVNPITHNSYAIGTPGVSPQAASSGYRNPTEDLAQHLQTEGRLNHSIVLRALCEGNLAFFEAGIARLAGIPVLNAHTLIIDHNPLAFRSLYEKAKMPRSTFNAVHVILRYAMRETAENTIEDGGYQRRLVEYLIQSGYDRSVPLMKYMMVLIASDLRTADVV